MNFDHFRSALEDLPPHLKETCDHVFALKKKYPHTEDFWNALYASAQDRYDKEQQGKETDNVSDNKPDAAHILPDLFSCFSNDEKCSKIVARVKTSNNMEESTRKEGYVIGIDPEGSDVALVMFTPEPEGIPHDFIIVMCPPNLLKPKFLKEFTCEKKPNKKLLEEFELLSVGKSVEINRESKTETSRYIIGGELKRFSIDNDLHFSISNGLVSKRLGTAAYVYRIFKERPIWFCEKETVAVKKIYSVDTAASAGHDCVILKEYLDPVSRRKPRAIVHDIARLTKLDLSYEVQGKKKVLEELEALSASATFTPTEFDMCLQFALCGESTLFSVGRFGSCKNGDKKCVCDVVKEGVDYDLWRKMRAFKNMCKGCKK